MLWGRSEIESRSRKLNGAMMTDWISKPAKLWRVDELFQRPDEPPAKPGLYAWYFDELPQNVTKNSGLIVDGIHLGYIGIAPARKPSPGRRGSNLRKRLRMHCAGNASGSTLRLTLGCLLARELGIELQRVGSSARLTFGEGERALSQWIQQHARVAWQEAECPWDQEADLIHRFAPPLNLDHNDGSPFHTELAQLRRACRPR